MPKIRQVSPATATQTDRAAASLPNNIAEGSGDIPVKERIRFFSYARRSASECHVGVRRAGCAGGVTETEVRISYYYADRLSAMLYQLIQGQLP